RVMESQPVAGEQNRFALLARLLQGPAAGALLSLDSNRPHPPGTLLTAAVENGALRLSSASEQVRQLDLLQGMRMTLPDQAPPTPSLRTRQQLASLPDLPPLLQASMQQVLKHVATPAHLATPAGVAQAIRQSGIFLEASLQQLQQALSTGNAAPGQGTAENTPAAVNLPPLTRLLPLLASLATPPGTEPLPGADFKASVLNLLITLQRHLPADPSRSLAMPPGPWQPSLQVRPGLFPPPTRAVQARTETPPWAVSCGSLRPCCRASSSTSSRAWARRRPLPMAAPRPSGNSTYPCATASSSPRCSCASSANSRHRIGASLSRHHSGRYAWPSISTTWGRCKWSPDCTRDGSAASSGPNRPAP